MVSGSFALLCNFLMSVLNVGRAAMSCRIQGECACTSVHLSIRQIERKEERKKKKYRKKKRRKNRKRERKKASP